jgi:GNAT superfamily N-acetyltransferase
MFYHENSGTKCFVAEDERGHMIGTSVCRPVLTPDEKGCKGEIVVLYVLPEHRGQGIGRRLMHACVLNLSEHGLLPFCLWTFKKGPARRFYNGLGGVLVGERETERGGKIAIEVCYRWEEVTSLIEMLGS